MEKVFSLGGEIGVYGELYGASGIEGRRPASTGRIYFRPTVSLLKTFNVNFDFLLSTEGSYARQSLDQFAIHPEWSWGRADAGDFSPMLSDFTVSGITIRGGGVEIYPGIFRMAAYGGLTRRAVGGNVIDAAFERTIAVGRIGVGRTGGDFIDVTVLRARDNAGSLKLPTKTDSLFYRDSTTVIDSLYATTMNDPLLTSPAENLVTSVNTGFSLFNGVMTFRGEAAAGVFTRDMNATALADSSKLSNSTLRSLNSLYTLRLSTSADYAVKTQIILNFRSLMVRGGFTRIGAGYTSLGLASQINDRQGFDLGFSSQLFDSGLSLNAGYDLTSDNLADQKLYTTQRSNISVNAGVRPAASVYIMLGYAGNLLSNDASNDTMKIDNTIASYMSNISFFVPVGEISNTLTLTGMVQTSDDGNILRKNMSSTSTTVMVNLSSAITADISVSPFGGITRIEISGSKSEIASAGIGFGYRMLDGKLNHSLSISSANSTGSNSVSLVMQSGFLVGRQDNLSLNVRYTSNTGVKSFSETQAGLSYAHRF